MVHKRGFVADSDDDDDFDDDEGFINVPIASPARRAAMAVMDVYEPVPHQQHHDAQKRQQQQQQQQERLATPETEPLSPAHQPAYEARPGSSDSTSKSAFASIYQAHAQLQGQHQEKEKQSRLIENIVRQSQKVVSSGTGGSGSGHGEGDESLSNPVSFGRINAGDSMMMLLSDRDEGPVLDEWDIPSSPEAGASATTVARSRRRSRGGGGDSGGTAGSSAPWDHEPTLPSLPAVAKRSRVSLHDTAADSAGNIGSGGGNGFYVAPSHLTTMQKLEYHRVSMPQMSTSEVLPALPLGGVVGGTPRMSTTQKSSGATTIAYTTPSRYASSGRPYPWEESMIVDEGGVEGNVDEQQNSDGEVAMEDQADEEIGMQLEADQEVGAEPMFELECALPEPEIIHIPSSPDIIGEERPSLRRRRRADLAEAVDDVAQGSPVRTATKPPAKKRKSRQLSYKEEADELAGHDDMWAVQDDDVPAESYKPRPSLRRAKAVTPRKEEIGKDLDQVKASVDDDELAPTQEPEIRPAKKPKRQIRDSDDEDDFAEQGAEPEPVAEPTPAPRKRGRKKKEHTNSEVVLQDPTEENGEEPQGVENHHIEPPVEEVATEIPEPPKKRGRKKKVNTPASVPVDGLTADKEELQPLADNTYVEPAATEPVDEVPEPAKKKRGRPKKADKAKESKAAKTQEAEPAPPAIAEVEDDEPVVNEEPKDEIKPHSPSPKCSPLQSKDPNVGMSPKKDQKQESENIKEKEVKPAAKAVSALSTPVNARYRVGLSKKSRIAPLLKIIRK